MIEAKQYDDTFFKEMEVSSLKSARGVLPLVKQFVQPSKIIDVGCGTGMWLHAWEELGVTDYIGVEGPYLNPDMIKVSLGKILFKDLKQPLGIADRFDLVMSLEVAEHLPAENAAFFVQSLTQLGDVILFSAAIPGQGGTYHINEQYPEYWATLFKRWGFIPVDCIRPNIWNDGSIEFWYRQNIIIFIKETKLVDHAALWPYAKATFPGYLTRIHPVFFDMVNQQMARTRSFTGFLNWKWYLLKQKLKGK